MARVLSAATVIMAKAPGIVRALFRPQPTVASRLVLGTICLVGLGYSAAPAQFVAATYFVSTSGDDANTCLAPSSACATVQGAIDKIPGGGLADIRIANGTY